MFVVLLPIIVLLWNAAISPPALADSFSRQWDEFPNGAVSTPPKKVPTLWDMLNEKTNDSSVDDVVSTSRYKNLTLQELMRRRFVSPPNKARNSIFNSSDPCGSSPLLSREQDLICKRDKQIRESLAIGGRWIIGLSTVPQAVAVDKISHMSPYTLWLKEDFGARRLFLSLTSTQTLHGPFQLVALAPSHA